MKQHILSKSLHALAARQLAAAHALQVVVGSSGLVKGKINALQNFFKAPFET